MFDQERATLEGVHEGTASYTSSAGFRGVFARAFRMFFHRLEDYLSIQKQGVQSQLEGMRSCVYYSNWSVYSRKHFPDQIPLEYTTNVFYAFFNVDPLTGEVKLSDSWADLELPIESHFAENGRDTTTCTNDGLIATMFALKKLHRHVKVSMSIGGWSNRDSFKEGLLTDEKLNRFVNSAVELMLLYGFDGIDLDWEYPETHHEISKYVLVMKKLRLKFRNIEELKGLKMDTILLTMASPAFIGMLSTFPVREIDRYLSFWNLMSYDFAGEWSETTGYHCNLYKRSSTLMSSDELCADDAVKYLVKKGIDSTKIVLGMANYGRSFTMTGGLGHPFHGVGEGSSDEKGIWSYNKLPLPGTKEQYDEQCVVAYCYDSKSKTFVSYDNPESVKKKGKYVHCMKLGGGMWWESCGDCYDDPSRSLIHNFVESIGGVQVLDQTNNLSTEVFVNSEFLISKNLV